MTKAVHLELVSNLTTEAFLFKCFVSRRGLPTDVFSDNESNFVGESNELKDVYYSLSQAKSQSQICKRPIVKLVLLLPKESPKGT